MAKFDNHPTVKWWREQSVSNQPQSIVKLNSDSLRSLCLEMGADDVGFVEIGRDALSKT
jgi:phosphatidate phosphatase PAH1